MREYTAPCRARGEQGERAVKWLLRKIVEAFLTVGNVLFTVADVASAYQVFTNLDKPEYATVMMVFVAAFSGCLGWCLHSSYEKFSALSTIADLTKNQLALMLAIHDDESGTVFISHGTEADRVARTLEKRGVVTWSDGENGVYPWHLEEGWQKFVERYDDKMRNKTTDGRLCDLGIVRHM